MWVGLGLGMRLEDHRGWEAYRLKHWNVGTSLGTHLLPSLVSDNGHDEVYKIGKDPIGVSATRAFTEGKQETQSRSGSDGHKHIPRYWQWHIHVLFFSLIYSFKKIIGRVLFKRSSICINFLFCSFMFLPPSLSIPDVMCLSVADSVWHRCPIHCSEKEMVSLATITTQKPKEFSLLLMWRFSSLRNPNSRTG